MPTPCRHPQSSCGSLSPVSPLPSPDAVCRLAHENLAVHSSAVTADPWQGGGCRRRTCATLPQRASRAPGAARTARGCAGRALLSFSDGVSNWDDLVAYGSLQGWNSSAGPCDWTFVGCNGSTVTSL